MEEGESGSKTQPEVSRLEPGWGSQIKLAISNVEKQVCWEND